MNVNQFVEKFFELLPKVMEAGINVLIPKEIQIWFGNNYELIVLLIFTLLLLGLTISIVKDIFNKRV